MDLSDNESIGDDVVEIQYIDPLTDGHRADATSISDSKHAHSKKPKRDVNVRASKGRKLRYFKIPKAVDFLFPVTVEHFTDMQRNNILAQMKESLN